MEVFPFFLSILVIIAALYWSARQHRRAPGEPISGLFRYQEPSNAASSRARITPGAELPDRPGQMRRVPPGPAAVSPPTAWRRFR